MTLELLAAAVAREQGRNIIKIRSTSDIMVGPIYGGRRALRKIGALNQNQG